MKKINKFITKEDLNAIKELCTNKVYVKKEIQVTTTTDKKRQTTIVTIGLPIIPQ